MINTSSSSIRPTSKRETQCVDSTAARTVYENALINKFSMQFLKAKVINTCIWWLIVSSLSKDQVFSSVLVNTSDNSTWLFSSSMSVPCQNLLVLTICFGHVRCENYNSGFFWSHMGYSLLLIIYVIKVRRVSVWPAGDWSKRPVNRQRHIRGRRLNDDVGLFTLY